MKKQTKIEQLKRFFQEVKEGLKKYKDTFDYGRHIVKTNFEDENFYYETEGVTFDDNIAHCTLTKVFKLSNRSEIVYGVHFHTSFEDGFETMISNRCFIEFRPSFEERIKPKNSDWEEERIEFNAKTWDITTDYEDLGDDEYEKIK